jgi:hypothetical protein
MVYWGRNFDRFSDVFMPYGAVVSIENLKGIAIGEAHNKTNGHQLVLGDFTQEPVAERVRAAARS